MSLMTCLDIKAPPATVEQFKSPRNQQLIYFGLSDGKPLIANVPRNNGLKTSKTLCVLSAEF